MDTSPYHPSDDSCNMPSDVLSDEESVYDTSVPEISRLMIDLPQSSDGNEEEVSVEECEIDPKLKIDGAKVECTYEHRPAEGVPTAKRKSGWPKGKKRKPVVDIRRGPKAPTTGYVLFLNERRKIYKSNCPELAFSEVTKLLGREWSNLCPAEKKKYLDKADADKKRYREELRSYRQAEAGPDSSNTRKQTQEFSLQDHQDKLHVSEDLYCDVCDVLFVSLHNKTEHFYGRQHLQAVTCAAGRSHLFQPSDVNQSILDFTESAIGREAEIKELTMQLVKTKDQNGNLLRKLVQVQALNSKLQSRMQRLKTEETCLKEQLHSLRMVPTLFGVIHFQH